MIDHYPAEVFWHEPSGCWVAIAPDFPGSSAVGDTRAEALTELQDCIAACIEANLATDRPIPQPTPHRQFA